MYKLQVPLIAQGKSNSCWHASAFMIWRYFQGRTGKQGPMNSLFDVYEDNNGISAQEFIKLAQTVGLKSIYDPMNLCQEHTYSSLKNLLMFNGPIWCAGIWFQAGHIIVLTGVNEKKVFFNDPDGGVAKSGSIQWFNEKLSQLRGSMMIKDRSRY